MTTIKRLLIILSTLLLAWLLPHLFHIVTDSAKEGRFLYYSSVNQSFCTTTTDKESNKNIHKDIKTGQTYSRKAFDSILPLLFYRQLLAEGRMPDSINSRYVDKSLLSKKSFFFRYRPKDKNKAQIPLYPLFESQSGRVNLEMPIDVFRINKAIEFIIPETNKIDIEKSNRFMQAFEKENFAFPPKIVAGTPSARKSYDEGYILADRGNTLFHFKMVKNEPFLKKIPTSSPLVLEHIVTQEPDDRSFYAFLFAKSGETYVLNAPNYKLQLLPIEKVNWNKESVTIFGNIWYWTIRIFSAEEEKAFAIDSQTKELVDEHRFEVDNAPHFLKKHLFPFELSWKNSYTRFITPKVEAGSFIVFLSNIFLVLLLFVIGRLKKLKIDIFELFWVAITGIFGFIPILLFAEKQ